jgi:hypothetical protein
VTVPDPDEPEHWPDTVGLHWKPAPQSESALHGSCQVNAQAFTVRVVHIGSIRGGGAPASGQGWLGGQAGVATAVPPEHSVDVSVWQTMPAPQSASAAQVFGSQIITVVAGGGEASGVTHAVPDPGLQPGSLGLGTVYEWQAWPCGQSASVAQLFCADAGPAAIRIEEVNAAASSALVNDKGMFIGPSCELARAGIVPAGKPTRIAQIWREGPPFAAPPPSEFREPAGTAARFATATGSRWCGAPSA